MGRRGGKRGATGRWAEKSADAQTCGQRFRKRLTIGFGSDVALIVDKQLRL